MAAPAAGIDMSLIESRLKSYEDHIKRNNERYDAQFKQQAEELASLRARPGIDQVMQKSLAAYQAQTPALVNANSKLERLIKGGLVAGSVVKIATKICLNMEQAAAKTILKKIPVISLIFGVVLAVGRYRAGDHWLKVAGEIASGVTGCFPGWGTATSLAIDGILLFTDVGEAIGAGEVSAPTFAAVIENVREAYACLGITWTEGEPDPDRRAVDGCYHSLAVHYHPDRAAGMGAEMVQRHHNLMVCLNGAKDVIYQHRGWR